MSSQHQREQIAKLCGKKETRKDAEELLSLALAKTGPGSGRDLGERRIALPAICALLASERLGNNDVVKKVAQDVSCLKPLHFEAALSTVRGALSGYLSRRLGEDVSYKSLCSSHGLNEDALYWMEEVDKELRKNGDMDDLEVDEETLLYVVFYWTCIVLNIRSVKRETIISKYRIPFHVFEEVEELLDVTCSSLKDSMSRSDNRSGIGRSTGSMPKSASRTKHKLASEERTASSSLAIFSTPTKTPTKAEASRSSLDASPNKRKAVLPPLPFMTPTKKQKTTSPVKLNRIAVTANPTSPSKGTAGGVATKASPLKTYGTRRSFIDTSSKSIMENELRPAQVNMQSRVQQDIAESPVTPIKSQNRRSTAEQDIPTSPTVHKSARSRASVVASSTLARKSVRDPPKFTLDSDSKTKGARAGKHAAGSVSDSSEDEEEERPAPCRHFVPVFADRLFYSYRDPRILREWNACEKFMKTLILDQ